MRSSSQSHRLLSSRRQISSYAARRSGLDSGNPNRALDEAGEPRSQVNSSKNNKKPITMLALINGLNMSTTGPNIPRKGSNKPHASSCCWRVASWTMFSTSAFFGDSTPALFRFPLALSFELRVSALELERTPALRAFTRSVAYVVCPSFAPFSMGPKTLISAK